MFGYLVGRVFVKNITIVGDAPSIAPLDAVIADLPETLPAYAALTSSSEQNQSLT